MGALHERVYLANMDRNENLPKFQRLNTHYNPSSVFSCPCEIVSNAFREAFVRHESRREGKINVLVVFFSALAYSVI